MTTAASANGVFDTPSAEAGIIPITLKLPRIYTMVAIRQPRMVARDTVLPEFSTLPAGMEAASIPTKANMVMAAVVVIASNVDLPLRLKGWKFAVLIKNNPPIATSTNGTSFRMVVTSCNLPDMATPRELTQVI